MSDNKYETKIAEVAYIEVIHCMCGDYFCIYCKQKIHSHSHINERGCVHCGYPTGVKILNPL
jgi:hypothetical protein